MSEIFAKGRGGGGASNDKDTLFSGDAFEIVLGIGEGPVKGIKGTTIAEQLQHVYLDGTPILGLNNEKNFKDSEIFLSYEKGRLFTVDEDPDDGQTPIPYILGGRSTSIPVGMPLIYNTPITRVVPSAYRNQYGRVEIRILVSRLALIKDDGVKKESVRVLLRYKPVSKVQWTSKYFTIAGKTLAGGFVKVITLGFPDTSEDLVFELTQLDESDPEKANRDLMWMSYELSQMTDGNGHLLREFHTGTAMVSMVSRIGENFVRLPTVTAVWQGLLCSVPSNYDPVTRQYDEATPWNGTFKAQKAWTNNPFWIARELILNPRIGMARYNPTVMTDDYSLYDEAKYADTLRTVTLPSGETAQVPLFTFNAVLSDQMQGLEFINYVLGSAHAQAVEYSSGFIKVISDRDMSSIMTVVPEMCVKQENDVVFTYSLSPVKERPNEVVVSYIDPDFDWQAQFIGPISDEDAQLRDGVNTLEFSAIGCTNPYEAKYKGYYRLISSQTEVLTLNFVIPVYAVEWDIGDIIDVVDPLMDWGLSGRASSIVGTTVTLRDRLYFEEAGNYQIQVQTAANTRVTRTITIPELGSYTTLTLDAAIPDTLERWPAFWITDIDGVPGNAKPFRVIAIAPADGQPHLFNITAIEVNRNKWAQALAMELGDAPRYSFASPRRPVAPTNLRWVGETSVGISTGSEDILSLTWDDQPETFIGLSYVLQQSTNGDPFVDVSFTRLNFVEVNVQANIEYVFRVKLVYQELELYSAGLEYSFTPYAKDDVNPANLTVAITGAFVENELQGGISARYLASSGSTPVDILTSGKVKNARVKFYGVEAGNATFICEKLVGREATFVLTESDQYQVLSRMYPAIRVVVQFIDVNGVDFPAVAYQQDFTNLAVPQISAISPQATSMTISAAAQFNSPLRRGMTVRWYLGRAQDGSDRVEVAQSAQLFAYAVNTPDIQYYLWAQVISPLGDSPIYPAGNGVGIKTLTLDEDSLGLQPTTYWLTRSAAVIRKTEGVYDINTLELSAFAQTGAQDPRAYLGIFKVKVQNTNGLWSDLYTSPTPEATHTITVPAGITSLNIRLCSGTDASQLLDEENTAIVDTGVSYAVQVVSSNGNVFKYGQATSTTMSARVYRNGVDVTDTLPASAFVWSRVSLNPLPAPNDDATWNAAHSGIKSFVISGSDVYLKATFFCDIML